ncbi:Hsp20/alpha crystallin family protein [Natranaerobius trueperi]|uniref:Uncharacterized protein n=1 Tax=Natranaerobius trueperi TaxID=759412 RepID=A0A226BVI8_9FIRM|nr:Hsp20/alpha crystallin family protein [Natranaerobius trueperi]OWZ82901.1 hypothetical protein CDO51_11505 [Natranaerobius trueperi]
MDKYNRGADGQDIYKLRSGLGVVINTMKQGLLKHDRCNTDIYEDEGFLVIQMELPGVSKDDINVDLKENTLKVTGEVYGYNDKNFEKTFPLPGVINTESQKHPQTNFDHGTLRIYLPLQSPIDDYLS